jgi:ATP-dependent RNA/DNA helicase IGHMBP2
MEFTEVKKYFNELKHALTVEMKEDEINYQEDLLKQSIQERKSAGITWFPIFIQSEYYGFLDHLYIDVQRKYFSEVPNNFFNGDKVRVFSNQSHADEDSIYGTISNASGNNLTIQLSVDEAPRWLSEGKIGVDKLFDKYSYEVMLEAIDYWAKEELSKEHLQLREVIIGDRKAHFQSELKIKAPSHLDDSQANAWHKAIEAQEVAVIHGPPGTGKTTTLIEIVKEKVALGESVLVCAASNAAVDVMTERLAYAGVNTVRIGNPAKITDENLKHCLDLQIKNHPEYSFVKELLKRADEFYRMANKYQRNFGRDEREQRKAIVKEAKSLKSQAEQHRQHIQQKLINNQSVITCTPVVTKHKELQGKIFDTVIFDEAGQSMEAMTWIAMMKAKKVILAGDHLQLPPTVKSDQAKQLGLSISLLEKLSSKKYLSEMLTVQYRMHHSIVEYPSKYFYEGKLQSFHANANHCIDANPVIQFIDTASTGYEEELIAGTHGIVNTQEADMLLKIVQEQYLKNKTKHSIGIISPYRQQVNYITEKLVENKIKEGISVQTVDGFQGAEKDVIFISLVRSNEKNDIGFLKDLRRMNVAITRARKKLVILGDSSTISNHDFYKGFIEFVESIGGYHSAYEFM